MKLKLRILRTDLKIISMLCLPLMSVSIWIGLISCNNDDDITKKSSEYLIGTWKQVRQGKQTVNYNRFLEFQNNGTLKITNFNGRDIELHYMLEDDWAYNKEEHYYTGRIYINESSDSQVTFMYSYYSCYIDSENKTLSLRPWFNHEVYYVQDPTSYYIKIK